MQRQGGLRVASSLVLALGAALSLRMAIAQERPEAPPAPSPGAKPDAHAGKVTVSFFSAEDTEVRKTGDEYSVLLRGDAHLAIDTAPEKVEGTLAEHQRLDLRAEDSVIFVPARKDGLAPDPTRLASAVRAIYCEGHVALVQETVRGADGKRAGPAFRLEAARLYIDLVAERVYAVDAVATLPGGTKRSPSLGVGSPGNISSGGTSQQATFTLHAERLRLHGADEIEAENASLSVCDFGLPHEAIEAARIWVTVSEERRKTPGALAIAAALGGPGATYVAWRAERNQPFRAFRELTRSKVREREGSDAILHAERDPRDVTIEGAALRVRPPFVGDDGFSLPFPLPIPYETDWLIPQVRLGHSSRFGYFGLAELKVPIVRQDLVHERTGQKKEDGDRHVREGLELDAIAAGAEYEKRGPAGDPGFAYEYRDESGKAIAKGQLRGFFMEDRGDTDRNGTPVLQDDRYWLRGVHQQELPLGSAVAKLFGISEVTSESPASLADGVHLDAEVSKQSDRDLLFEYFRRTAYTDKQQETYIYLRRAWDEIGARMISRWRLNDFQTQTEELPSARVDFLQTPLVVTDRFGGLYLTLGIEGAHLRTRVDDAFPDVPDERLGRGDFDARVDYKVPILNILYARAYGEGRYTAWSQQADQSGSIDRVIGSTGAHLGSQADGVVSLTDSVWLRHVIEPEAGFEDRYYVSKEPERLIPVDEIETYRPGEYVFLRLRNRLQYAEDGDGKKAHDLVDVTVESRYFPTSERLNPGQRIWGTCLGDGRIYLGPFGNIRTETEVDPNRHRLLKLESTFTLLATRSFMALTADAKVDDRVVYPDIAFSVGYHDVVDIARALSWSFDVRLTACWGFQVQEIYDFLQHSFLRHRFVIQRRFHNWAFEMAGSYDPFLKDTSFSFSVLPLLEDEEHDPFREGPYEAGF